MRWTFSVGLVVAILSEHIAFAEVGQPIETAKVREITVPVFEGNANGNYRILGEVNDNLRKPFAFMANPTKDKIYAEIWERGRKMGADAVINARYGETKRTLFNHGSTPISGTAIKYTNEGKPGN